MFQSLKTFFLFRKGMQIFIFLTLLETSFGLICSIGNSIKLFYDEETSKFDSEIETKDTLENCTTCLHSNLNTIIQQNGEPIGRANGIVKDCLDKMLDGVKIEFPVCARNAELTNGMIGVSFGGSVFLN